MQVKLGADNSGKSNAGILLVPAFSGPTLVLPAVRPVSISDLAQGVAAIVALDVVAAVVASTGAVVAVGSTGAVVAAAVAAAAPPRPAPPFLNSLDGCVPMYLA